MTQQNSSQNFVKLPIRAANRSKYAFVDSLEHRADRILIGALIPASFERHPRSCAADAYELRICSFDSKYESWFLNCMADLEWVLEGDDPEGGDAYAQACQQLLGFIAAA